MAAAMTIEINLLVVVFMGFQTSRANMHDGFEAGESM